MKTITFQAGRYHRKFFFGDDFYRENGVEDHSLRLAGAGMDKTLLTFADAGRDVPEDLSEGKVGTFRSYTVFVTGRHVEIEDLTIENAAGDGLNVGQAIALYADADEVLCRHVHLIGHQDTLFMSPLPEKVREPNGFRGPREKDPRRMTRQRYTDCIIEGNVDFIFGGANAVFEHCLIRCLPRGHEKVQGYVCAPCTPWTEEGFVFIDCTFENGGCPDGSVYLGRPWRPGGAAVFRHCTFGPHIHPDLFARWNETTTDEEMKRFRIE